MEINANNSGETHHGGGVKVSWMWCLEFPDAELNCSCGIFAGADAQLVLMSSKSINQRVSQILHSSTTNLQTQSATSDWAVNTTGLHLGPLNPSCVLGSARLTGYRPLLLSAFGYLRFTKQQKSRLYWFVPGTLRDWSQPTKLKPYRSPWGIWVNAASTVIKDWRDNIICTHLAIFNTKQQIIQWDKSEPGRDFSGKKKPNGITYIAKLNHKITLICIVYTISLCPDAIVGSTK